MAFVEKPLILSLAFGCAVASAAVLPVNLDFENGATGWNMPAAAWKVVPGAGVDGTAAMIWENADPACYCYPWQRVELEPGRTYNIGARVKIEKLKDGIENRTYVQPQVGVEWFDKDGKYVGGSYLYGPVEDNAVDTSGWKRYEGKTEPIPSGVAWGKLDFFVKNGFVGKVAFDNIVFAPDPERPVDFLVFGRYRDEAADGKVRVCASLHVNTAKTPLDSLVPELRYVGTDGKTVVRTDVPFDATDMVCELDVDKLAFGRHPIGFALRRKSDGSIIGKEQRPFTRLRAPAKRRVTFDAANRVLVDGRRFFPLGMYTGGAGGFSADRLKRFKEGNFNCACTYYRLKPGDLDAFAAAGVMVLPSLIDYPRAAYHKGETQECTNKLTEAVARFKDHPAVLAWYLGDEMQPAGAPICFAAHDLLHALDPDHPVWFVLDRPRHVRLFRRAYDVIGVDPYPIGNTRGGIDIASGWVAQANKGTLGSCDNWSVPQAFDWGWFRGPADNGPDPHFPREDEYVNMQWQQIAAGANGLIGYAFHHIFEDYCKDPVERERVLGIVLRTARTIAARIPVLLEDPGCEIVALPDGVIGRTWRHEGRNVVLLCNVRREAVRGSVTLSEPFARAAVDFGPVPKASGKKRLELELGPLGISMFSLEK